MFYLENDLIVAKLPVYIVIIQSIEEFLQWLLTNIAKYIKISTNFERFLLISRSKLKNYGIME